MARGNARDRSPRIITTMKDLNRVRRVLMCPFASGASHRR